MKFNFYFLIKSLGFIIYLNFQVESFSNIGNFFQAIKNSKTHNFINLRFPHYLKLKVLNNNDAYMLNPSDEKDILIKEIEKLNEEKNKIKLELMKLENEYKIADSDNLKLSISNLISYKNDRLKYTENLLRIKKHH